MDSLSITFPKYVHKFWQNIDVHRSLTCSYGVFVSRHLCTRYRISNHHVSHSNKRPYRLKENSNFYRMIFSYYKGSSKYLIFQKLCQQKKYTCTKSTERWFSEKDDLNVSLSGNVSRSTDSKQDSSRIHSDFTFSINFFSLARSKRFHSFLSCLSPWLE